MDKRKIIFDYLAISLLFQYCFGLNVHIFIHYGNLHVVIILLYLLNSFYSNTLQIHERFQDTITYYVLDSRIYGRGVCSFSQNMPVDQGSYTYSMDIDPGSQNIFYKTINIGKMIRLDNLRLNTRYFKYF